MKVVTLITLTSLAMGLAACGSTSQVAAVKTGASVEATDMVLASELLKTDAPTGALHAFAIPSRRMAGGFDQVTLAELAKTPEAFFRDHAAYLAFKRSFELQLDKDLSDKSFTELLASGQVEVRPCAVSSLRTAGIDDDGHIGWISRACQPGENLIFVKGTGGWVAVAAMGCLNPLDAPVRRNRIDPAIDLIPGPVPPTPEPPPVPEPQMEFVRPNLASDLRNSGNPDYSNANETTDPGAGDPSVSGATSGTGYSGAGGNSHNRWN
jgi:hypothetical protein